MRLLFDENLSPALPGQLAGLFPDSVHVRDLGLVGADDLALWRAAAEQGLVLTTKDDDFVELSILRGAPPKVLRITLGNCRTAEIVVLLSAEHARIERFVGDAEASILMVP